MSVTLRSIVVCLLVCASIDAGAQDADSGRGADLVKAGSEAEDKQEQRSAVVVPLDLKGVETNPVEVTPEIAPAAPPPAVEVPAQPKQPLQVTTFAIDQIKVEGQRVLVPEVDEIIRAYEGKTGLTTDDLYNLRVQINQLHHDAGYINSGVYFEDQEVQNQTITLTSVVGQSPQVDINPQGRLAESYIRRRLPEIAGPLNRQSLEAAITRLQADPMIRRIDAQLIPGKQRGRSILAMDVVPETLFFMNIGTDNYSAPSVDEHRTNISLQHRSLFGWGDTVSLSGSFSEGADNYAVSYALPVTSNNVTLNALYSDSDASIVEAPFNRIDIESRTRTTGIGVTVPVEGLGWLRNLSLTLEQKRGESSLLGIPFSLSPGEVQGKTTSGALRLAGQFYHRSERRVLALRLQTSFGVDLGNRLDTRRVDENYVVFLVQGQYARRFSWRQSLLEANVAWQHTADSLLAVEKIAVGGHSTVRGYNENLFVRDTGGFASVQYWMPVLVNSVGRSRIGLSVGPFVDYGVARNKRSDAEDVASVGIALRWQPHDRVLLEAAYGHALNGGYDTTDTLQSDGIHVRLNIGLFGVD